MGFITYTAPPTWLSEQPLDERIVAGDHSYFTSSIRFALWRADERVEIGGFCSIAAECLIFGGGNHYVRQASTFPFHAFGVGGPDAYKVERWSAPSRPTVVGSDVWLGHGVRVMPGASIGHGAVVGAGAVVRNELAPYTIAVGNPATVVRSRFPAEVITRLLELAWWNWPLGKVLANVDWLLADPTTWPDTLTLRDGDDQPTARLEGAPNRLRRLMRTLRPSSGRS